MNLIKLKNEIYRKGYNIGFFDANYLNCSDKVRNRTIKWLDMNGYNTGWFADPFFLNIDLNYYYILAEEFVYETNKGRLVKLTIQIQGCKLVNVDVILDLNTHLSFPIIINEDDNVYVYPENYQSGALSVYLYDKSKDKLILKKQIINEPLLDAQIIKYKGKYFAFGVKWVTNTQEDTKHLMIFEGQSLFGPYRHIQTIHNEKNEERGAGQIFISDGMIYRPAQCCEGGYGKAVILYKLTYKKGLFKEDEMKRFLPNERMKYGKVLHTFNRMNEVCVIDGYDYAHPYLVKIIDLIRKILSI